MSKLSFVALSLQTTHLDPASVSKVSYVKLVDGNITRQDDLPIIPPTSKKKTVNGHTEGSLISWKAALEKLAMMIGKLPIVSYYRDADKEIFHAASRQLNIEPPALHWLDCRELARKLLPELPDVQLSTVLKTLDLYDDYADSSAVEQTTQIVIALAQRQGAKTVAQLWDELYDHPEDLLGLDSTFEGAAESGSSTDEEKIDAPLAAEVLPFAAAAGAVSQPEEQDNAAASETDDAAPTEEAVGDESSDESGSLEAQPTLETTEVASSTEESGAQPLQETATGLDPMSSPMAGAEELPLFLQEPSRDEQEELETESAELEHPDDSASELPGATAATSGEATGTEGEFVASGDAALSEDEGSVESTEIEASTVDEGGEELHASANGAHPLAPDASSEDVVEPVEAPPAEPVVEDTAEPLELEEQSTRAEASPEKLEQQQVPASTTDQVEPATQAPDEASSESPQDLPRHEQPSGAPEGTSAMPILTPPVAKGAFESETSSTSSAPTAQAVEVSQRPRAEVTPRRTSNVNQIFGFVGLFLFGVLTIIGVVLVVMAVMLFFTENSLMLETKIAGVILTLAITLLSLLMTNVSYRSFRKK